MKLNDAFGSSDKPSEAFESAVNAYVLAGKINNLCLGREALKCGMHSELRSMALRVLHSGEAIIDRLYSPQAAEIIKESLFDGLTMRDHD